MSYDYRLFQYYGDHIAEGTVVFIPVSYFSLFGTGEVHRDDFATKNKRYYSILPSSLIKEYDFETDIYAKYLPALTANTGDLIKTLLRKTADTIAIDDVWPEAVTDMDVTESAESIAYLHTEDKERFYDDGGNRIENQEEIGALYGLVRGCQDNGAVPILITTPYLHEYTDAVKEKSEGFYDHFYSIIGQVVKDTGVEYYDYAFDERFASGYSWFWDSTHLNKEGARRFTNILMQEIVYAKGYLQPDT